MKKIPTIFERDWEGDKSRVLDKPTAECEWVFNGEGVATRKYDGQAASIIDGKLYRRLEMLEDAIIKRGIPAGAIECDRDPAMAKVTFWVPVGDRPEDKYFREAWDRLPEVERVDGTYELLGPKVQGNPEGLPEHRLLNHTLAWVYPDCPRTFDGLESWFEAQAIEGIVFHHPSGRMAKIKKRDFGLKRQISVPA